MTLEKNVAIVVILRYRVVARSSSSARKRGSTAALHQFVWKQSISEFRSYLF